MASLNFAPFRLHQTRQDLGCVHSVRRDVHYSLCVPSSSPFHRADGFCTAVNQASLTLPYTNRAKLAAFAGQIAWFRKPAPVALSGNPFTSNVTAELPMLSSFGQQLEGMARL